MSRIAERFARLKAERRAGLVAYVSAGDPDAELGYQILKGLPGAGVDVIEIGMNLANCCCLLGAPAGIWSLIVLFQPGVRGSFE